MVKGAMSDNARIVMIAMIAGLPATVAAITGAYMTMNAQEHFDNKIGTVENKVEEIHKATNSMKDALVKVTGESERAKGVIEGAAQENRENKAEQQRQRNKK